MMVTPYDFASLLNTAVYTSAMRWPLVANTECFTLSAAESGLMNQERM